ncbi:helix-turn-helix transcriptional regulator [Streptomyces cyanogenus]|uniref:Bacterial regulatory protein, LuxR family n=1 Tax=Streptomyces cyanogenus TaxID=80860 RepID=A0ABX7TVM5_STRCY|nr:LuxR family transcriptional regulator [Streptomyces cyanogenus]QTD99718.1 Bacterial regulatory protein, LuxR family [Streptomyces cyanogenus]
MESRIDSDEVSRPSVQPQTLALGQEAEVRRLIERTATALRDMAGEFEHLGDSLGRTPPPPQPDVASYTLEYLTEPEKIAEALSDAAAVAVTEILSTHPGPVPPDAELAAELKRTRHARARDVVVRSVYGECYFKSPNGAKHLRSLTGLGVQVRLLGSVPLRLIVSDGLTMFSGPEDDGLAVLRPELITRAARRVLEYWWVTATPLDDLVDRLRESPTPQEQAILRLMSAGVRDEVIAREIGVSIRTLRRTLAAVMDKLGAENRFQAGIKAVARGWL